MGTTGRAAQNLEALGRFLGAVEAGDIDAVRACYHPDAVVWHSDDGIEQSVEDNLRTLSWLARNVPGLHYENVRRHATDDVAVEQHDTVVPIPGRDRPLVMTACLVVAYDAEARITRLDEYLDSGDVARLREALTAARTT